ncbi:glutaredoxin 3 [Corallococcus sp. ZKHCc1 1396]|uniref:Glutaredoxin n=1 Tax=Corallococcus soli TaxID=2710757 RepID=A0ABR9PLI3_9BACT|nr:glutaredoxin 3 [Corallococcus sp. BB11-1]MBE4748772.1 glutaredoxin 3 [Corallococcus soli]MCY1031407.1 glutaredoxin 3 [Corallococcus sp. BB11-1]
MKPVKIYTTTYCGFCVRAKDLLKRKGVDYTEVDVTGDDDARAKLVEMSGGQRTVPQIFIGDTHVGGYSDLAELDKQKKLDPMLSA